MDLEVLLAVEAEGGVDGQPRYLSAEGREEAREGRDHTEARQDGQPLLVGVGQFGGVSRAAETGADAEVVEDDVIGVPGRGEGRDRRAQGDARVDGHRRPSLRQPRCLSSRRLSSLALPGTE